MNIIIHGCNQLNKHLYSIIPEEKVDGNQWLNRLSLFTPQLNSSTQTSSQKFITFSIARCYMIFAGQFNFSAYAAVVKDSNFHLTHDQGEDAHAPSCQWRQQFEARFRFPLRLYYTFAPT